jgi:hypothetical protein
MRDRSKALTARARRAGVLAFKILIESDSVKFDENSRLIHILFAQNPRFNTNNSFKPVCYGLVQRRRNSRRG